MKLFAINQFPMENNTNWETYGRLTLLENSDEWFSDLDHPMVLNFSEIMRSLAHVHHRFFYLYFLVSYLSRSLERICNLHLYDFSFR